MAQWQTLWQAARPTVGKLVAAFGLLIVLAEYSQLACPLGEIFGAAASMALGVLPSVLLAVGQTLQGHGCEHARLWEGLLQILGSCWPTLLNVFAA